jgi:sugar phosphate isomerase/epimerase
MATAGFSINVRIGLWLDDLRLGIKQGLKTIAPLKAEAVGLDAFGAEVAPRVLSQTGRRDLAQYIRARGLALSALRADVGGRRLADRRTLDPNLTRLREALQLAADLGAPYLVVPAGYIPGAEKEDAVARDALVEAAKVLSALASSTGVRVCWLGGGEAPETLKLFLDQWDSAGVIAVDLNPGACVMRGIDPLKALNALSWRVSLVSAADHYRGGAEAPFGQGDVRWGELLIALSALPAKAPVDLLAACTLDGDRVQALSVAVRRLQALRRNPVT